ncbi:MAG: multiprotein bridging factor aMBF1 [Candidatus Bathyarchaeia archaeon]
MQCDVCGREIIGRPYRVIIEGAKVITCVECAKLGSGYWTPEDETRLRRAPSSLPRSIKLTASSKLPQQVSQVDFEIIEGFGSVIKRAREKLGLTPEDLGKIVGEKESVIKKIESEKIVPDVRLAVKLERALKIKLLIRQPETDLDRLVGTSIKGKRSVTLGEVVQIKGEGREGID